MGKEVEEFGLIETPILRARSINPLFSAVVEAVEEAIIDSLFTSETMEGRDNHVIDAIPSGKVIELLRSRNALISSAR
ncbi:MAG: hypothetical protein DRO05_06920 [Thermoproteota archaeon]|nr:MAG: hypothetical protein DRO05_06920 [Candidatus Korarchaeota archaeon]